MSNEGILNQISIGVESSLGTPVAPTISLPVLPSDGVKTEQAPVPVEAIDTTPAKNKGFVQGLREYPGSFEMNAYPQALGYLFKSIFGDVTSALEASETAVYKHDFAEVVSKAGLTVEQVIGTSVERFTGFVVGKVTIEGKVGEAIKITFEGRALSVASNTKITPTYEVSKVFDWTDVQSIAIGGTDIKSAIEEFSIEYSVDLNNFHGFASNGEPSILYIKNSEVKGSMNGYQDTNTLGFLTNFRDVDESDLVITIEGDETIGTVSKNKLVVTVPKIAFSKHEMPIDVEYNQVALEFEARKDETNGLIKAQLINEVSSY